MRIEIQLRLNAECGMLRFLSKTAPYEGLGTNHIDEIPGELVLYSCILLDTEENLIMLLLSLDTYFFPFLY